MIIKVLTSQEFINAMKKALEPTIKAITKGVQETLQEVAKEGNILFKKLSVARHRVQTGNWADSEPIVAYTDDPNKLSIDFDGSNKQYGQLEFKNVGTKPYREIGKKLGREGRENLKNWAITKGIYQSAKDMWKIHAIANAFYKGRNIGGAMFGVSGSNFDGTTKNVFERNIYDQVSFEVINAKNIAGKLKVNLKESGLEVK